MRTAALLSGLCLAFSAAAAEVEAPRFSDVPVDLPKLTVTPIEDWATYLDHMSLYVAAEIGITAKLPPLRLEVAAACLNLAEFGDAFWLEGATSS